MDQGSIFQSKRCKAARLPKAVAFRNHVERADTVVLEQARIIPPVGELWDSGFDSEGVTEDFMTERGQPSEQERESF